MQMVVFAAKDYSPRTKSVYMATYRTYEEVWAKAFPELDKPSAIFSNDFTRQDYIVSLMDGDTCAACSFFREVNIKNPIHRKDSWFKEWPNEIFDKLTNDGLNSGLIYSYGTVHSDYRKSKRPELKTFLLIGYLSMLQAQQDQFQLMFGATRNSHKVDEACSSWGSITLKENISYFNTNADLVVFTPSSVSSASEKYPALAFDLFNHRLDLRHQ